MCVTQDCSPEGLAKRQALLFFEQGWGRLAQLPRALKSRAELTFRAFAERELLGLNGHWYPGKPKDATEAQA